MASTNVSVYDFNQQFASESMFQESILSESTEPKSIIGDKTNQLQRQYVLLDHGTMDLPTTVPLDKTTLMKMMKGVAKKVQFKSDSKFVEFRLDNDNAKVFGKNEPTKLLYEIDLKRIVVVKQSKKDRTFIYFTVRNDRNKTIDLTDGLSQTNVLSSDDCYEPTTKSVYTCFIYHAISYKKAERIFLLLKQYADQNNKSVMKLSQSAVKEKTTMKVDELCDKPDSTCKQFAPEMAVEAIEDTSSDLLLALDDYPRQSLTSRSDTSNLIDDLIGLNLNTGNNVNEATNQVADLLGMIDSRKTYNPPLVTNSQIYPKHDTVNTDGFINRPTSQTPSTNAILTSVGHQLYPTSLYHPLAPSFGQYVNPLIGSKESFVVAPPLHATQMPNPNRLNQQIGQHQRQVAQYQSHYPSHQPYQFTTNPFDCQTTDRKSFDPDFNDFLSKTIKSHFNVSNSQR